MDDELRSFVSARWAPLVRTFVALGPGVEDAARLAQQALGRFADEVGADLGDADVRLAETVVETWAAEGPRWWTRARAPRPASPDWARVEVELDRLGDADRLTTALAAGLRLPRERLRDVLDVEPPPVALVERAAAALGVLALPAEPDGVRAARSRRGPGRRARVLAATALALLLATAGWNLATDGSRGDSDERSVRVLRVENALPATWFADGRLHLDDVVVRVPGVTSFEAWTGGAVVAGADGRLVAIAADGTARPVGETRPGARYALEPRLGLLAFIDTAAAPAVNVIDVSTGESRLRQRTAGPESAVVAMAGTVVVQADRRGYTRTQIRTALTKVNTVLVPRRGLTDLAGTSRLFLRDATLIADDGASRPTRLQGVEDAGLSDDGRYAWVRRSDLPDPGVLDLPSREGLSFGLPDHEAAASVALVRGALAPQAVFVLALGADRYQLVACLLDGGACDDPVEVSSPDVPLLGG